jgi:hypothetical protein
MTRFCLGVLWTMLLVTAPGPALAQGLPTTQPALMRIYREDVKPGRTVDHARNEAGWVAAYERAKSPDYYLAMESLTSNEAWFVVPAASYAAIGEQMGRDMDPALRPELDRLGRVDGDLLNGSRIIELRARPDLSSGAYPDIATQRFWEVTLFRMRPGSSQTVAAAVKAYMAAGERAGRKIGWRTYEVSAGMPAPTYFVFSSVPSFGDFDALLAQDEATGKSFQEADAEIFKKFDEAMIETETFRFRLSPGMSYVPKAVRDADPAFWMPKKLSATKPAPAAPKPTTNKP